MQKTAVKVLFLSAEADIKGGGERFLLDVITGLAGEFEIACVCPSDGALSVALRKMGIRVYIVPIGWSGKLRNRLVNYFCVCHLSRLVRSFAPQVVYANGGHINNMAVRLARRLRCRCVANVHDLFTPVQRDKYAFGLADRVVACSSGVADIVRPFNPEVRVLYNGVDTGKYSPVGRVDARERLGVRDGQFVVGFSGTLVEKKGIVEFIDVARLMAAKVPEAVFVVAGAPKPGEEGILTRLKDRVAEAGLDGRLHWLGFVEDLHMVMPGMDVFLFPAHDEAFGRVIIEAMACGVVPVSSLAGGPREIIEDGRTGFLKPYTDISSFAEALMLLYRDAALRSGMAAAARDAVVSRFSIAAMLSGVRDVILSAVNKG